MIVTGFMAGVRHVCHGPMSRDQFDGSACARMLALCRMHANEGDNQAHAPHRLAPPVVALPRIS